MVMFVVGFLIGICMGALLMKWVEKPSGTLKLVHDHDDGEYYLFLELSEVPARIADRRQVLLDVDSKSRE